MSDDKSATGKADGGRAEGGWKTNYFLCNHAAHADSHNVEFALGSPAKLIDDLDHVFRHLRGRVAHHWFIGFSNASIVEDEHAVLGGTSVAKVFRLSLP